MHASKIEQAEAISARTISLLFQVYFLIYFAFCCCLLSDAAYAIACTYAYAYIYVFMRLAAYVLCVSMWDGASVHLINDVSQQRRGEMNEWRVRDRVRAANQISIIVDVLIVAVAARVLVVAVDVVSTIFVFVVVVVLMFVFVFVFSCCSIRPLFLVHAPILHRYFGDFVTFLRVIQHHHHHHYDYHHVLS